MRAHLKEHHINAECIDNNSQHYFPFICSFISVSQFQLKHFVWFLVFHLSPHSALRTYAIIFNDIRMFYGFSFCGFTLFDFRKKKKNKRQMNGMKWNEMFKHFNCIPLVIFMHRCSVSLFLIISFKSIFDSNVKQMNRRNFWAKSQLYIKCKRFQWLVAQILCTVWIFASHLSGQFVFFSSFCIVFFSFLLSFGFAVYFSRHKEWQWKYCSMPFGLCEFHGSFHCDVMFVVIKWKMYKLIGQIKWFVL